jgi:hypothetical protein
MYVCVILFSFKKASNLCIVVLLVVRITCFFIYFCNNVQYVYSNCGVYDVSANVQCVVKSTMCPQKVQCALKSTMCRQKYKCVLNISVPLICFVIRCDVSVAVFCLPKF